MDVSFEMTANGHDVSFLQSIIEARKRELGETTKQAATATAIQILKSLRANTLVADPNKMKLTVKVASGFVVGWKTKGGKRERCLRLGNAEINSSSYRDIAGKYVKGENLLVYSVIDSVEGAKSKTQRYMVIARSSKDAEHYAKVRHVKRVKQFSGMAKYALTLAMMKTAGNAKVSQVGNIAPKAKNTAAQNVEVRVNETGWNKGEVSIDIHDALDYAAKALKNGEGFVTQAIQNASNSIIGMINNKMKRNGSLHEKIAIPFPKG